MPPLYRFLIIVLVATTGGASCSLILEPLRYHEVGIVSPDGDGDADADADGDGDGDGDTDADVDTASPDGDVDFDVEPFDASPCPGPDTDGDGLPDTCDPCPEDPLNDLDDDGVCDSGDRCIGWDDALDADGDGRPDGCDPCSLDGPLSPLIPDRVESPHIAIQNVSLGGGGKVIVVRPTTLVTVRLDYEIWDCECPGCNDQIQIGLVPGDGPLYCAYDGNPPQCGWMHYGYHTDDIMAPDSIGEHHVRFGFAQDYSCFSTRDGWWSGVPPAEMTIGAVCVVEDSYFLEDFSGY